MRRTLIVMSIVGVTMFVARPASAVIVECANCSTIYEELISDARQVQQLATQLDSYRTQLQQYANMVTNTISLPEEVFSPVINDINQVRNIANAASLLTGGSGSIMTRLQSISGYASMAATMPGNFPNQLVMWNQTLGNAQRSLGSVLGIQQGQQVTYAAQQAAIQNQLQTAAGQMQAIQATGALAALTNTQLNQIQSTLTAQAQMVATKMVLDQDRIAAEDAYSLNLTRYQQAPMTGNPSF